MLKARLAEVEATLAETQEANRRLQDILRAAQREKFGKRSEKLSPDQFNLPLEDAEFAQGVLEAAQEKAEAAMQRARGEPPRKPKRNRGHLPSHLPRIERVIEPASTLCPCGCGEMARIGEDVSERLDVIPAQFRVLVTRRALGKATWPGVWTNSVCGHPAPDESVADAVARRVRHELGAGVEALEEALPDFRYRAVDDSGVVENEVCPVFVGRLVGEPRPRPDEVEALAWAEPARVGAALRATPFAFSPWFVEEAALLDLYA